MAHDLIPAGEPERRADRRVEALKLRQVGHTYRVIAELMGISVGYAHTLVDGALKDLAAQSHHEAESLRTLEMSRLDEYMLLLGPLIAQGDLAAIDRAIKINESRRKLLGIDVPVKSVQMSMTPEQVARLSDADLETYIGRFTASGAGAQETTQPT